jgi:hypothetical protein
LTNLFTLDCLFRNLTHIFSGDRQNNGQQRTNRQTMVDILLTQESGD